MYKFLNEYLFLFLSSEHLRVKLIVCIYIIFFVAFLYRKKEKQTKKTPENPDGKSQLIGKNPKAGKDRRQKEKRAAEDEMVGWHHRFSGHEFEQTPGDGGGQGSLACCSSWQCKESDTTQRLNHHHNNVHSFRKYQTLFSKWLHHFIFLPEKYENSSCFTSSPTSGIVSLFHFSHASEYGVVFHCGFSLHFLDD